jgi:digalactosyldiacylglycerol synthase
MLAAVTCAKELNDKKKSSGRVISLAESINRSTKLYQDPERIKQSRLQWKKALEEIKQLTLPRGDDKRVKEISLMQWKMLSEEPVTVELDTESNLTTAIKGLIPEDSNVRFTPRFEGFASWERMLQDWSDDVQDYMDKIEAENAAGYRMSSWGSSGGPKTKETDIAPAEDIVPHFVAVPDTRESKPKTDDDQKQMKTSISLPVPAPAKDGEPVLPHTDLSDKSKRIWIVTTASLPWMTGTAVNPLLRAAYMTKGRKEAGGSVTLMLPWLERRQDQERVYGPDKVFESAEDQEEFVRKWMRESAKMPKASEELNIEWYTAWQNKAENSVYSMGDITAEIPDDMVDIMILEEPEHLNWYRAPGESWTDKFRHVVGIIHTNYFVYAAEQPAAFIRAPAMRLLCSWMCRAHCHRIIKLSGTLGQFAPEKELIENVHGIRGTFLDAGKEVRKRILASPDKDPVFGAEADPSIYFIGKMLWSKGLGSLMELLKYAEESAGIKVKVDMYGGGPDKDAAEAKAKVLDVDMEFHGPIDHGALDFSHKVGFALPSSFCKYFNDAPHNLSLFVDIHQSLYQ